jgi:photosystem II stability/assembly factor-like uncharacterized protein
MKYGRFVVLILGALVVLLPHARTGRTAPPVPPSFDVGEDDSDLIRERIRLYLQRHGDQGVIEPERRLERVRSEYTSHREEESRRQISGQAVEGNTWASLGPTNGAGRATAIAVHPTTMGTVYIGAAGGGVWKTTDDGNTWAPLTDSINDLSVGALALAPSAPNIVYLGTGEGGIAIDFIPGIGFLKSTDGGNNWIFPSSVIATTFYRISVHPANSQELVVGTNRGGLRSTDGGASWTTVIDPNIYRDVTDIVRDPADASVLFATTWDELRWCASRGNCSFASPRVLKSTDGGVTWSERSNGLPQSTGSLRVNRMSIAISPVNHAVLYVVTAVFDSSTGDEVSHILKSTDSGGSWVDLPGVANSGNFNVSHFLVSQAWYNNTIVVSPSNDNIVIAAGTLYIRSTDGGASWGLTPFEFTGSAPHVDVHDLRYEGSNLFMANDGGIWTSPDNGVTSIDRTSGLVTRQYYALAIDPANPNRILGGAQDNGTTRRPDSGGTQWSAVIGADGFQCDVNRNAPSFAYGTVQFGTIERTKSAGTNPQPRFLNITPQYSQNEGGQFLSIIKTDPSSPADVYTATYRVWKSTDGGDTWVSLPTTITDGTAWTTTETISAVAVSRSNNKVIMAYKANFGIATVFGSTDGGNTWVNRSKGIPVKIATNIEIDPRNSDVAYISFSGTAGVSVYKTIDAGANWNPSGNGLPSFSAQVVRVDPTDSNVVYCGTDVGVYKSTDQGASWSKFGTGLPSSSIHDLQISDDGSMLRAATHGRGIWELQVPATGNHPPVAAILDPAAGMGVAKGATVSFSGSVTDADAGDTATGQWVFPDTWEMVPTAAGATTVSHTFNRAGVFPVTLNAKDGHGAVSSTSILITVPEPADSCSAPAVIPGSGPFPFTVSANNETATRQLSDPSPTCAPVSSSLWFEFTPATAAFYEFTTCGSNVNLSLSLWTGPQCGPYTQVSGACSRGVSQTSPCFRTRTSEMIVTPAAGQTLRLLVANSSSNDIGTFLITVNRYTSLIQGVSVQGKNLIVTGQSFVAGAVLMMNGVDQKTFLDAQNPATVIIGRKTARKIDSGQTVRLQVRNPDGSISNGFMFTKP